MSYEHFGATLSTLSSHFCIITTINQLVSHQLKLNIVPVICVATSTIPVTLFQIYHTNEQCQAL
jgi:hypothetical protein